MYSNGLVDGRKLLLTRGAINFVLIAWTTIDGVPAIASKEWEVNLERPRDDEVSLDWK
jgi:hypothetical protein